MRRSTGDDSLQPELFGRVLSGYLPEVCHCQTQGDADTVFPEETVVPEEYHGMGELTSTDIANAKYAKTQKDLSKVHYGISGETKVEAAELFFTRHQSEALAG